MCHVAALMKLCCDSVHMYVLDTHSTMCEKSQSPSMKLPCRKVSQTMD